MNSIIRPDVIRNFELDTQFLGRSLVEAQRAYLEPHARLMAQKGVIQGIALHLFESNKNRWIQTGLTNQKFNDLRENSNPYQKINLPDKILGDLVISAFDDFGNNLNGQFFSFDDMEKIFLKWRKSVIKKDINKNEIYTYDSKLQFARELAENEQNEKLSGLVGLSSLMTDETKFYINSRNPFINLESSYVHSITFNSKDMPIIPPKLKNKKQYDKMVDLYKLTLSAMKPVFQEYVAQFEEGSMLYNYNLELLTARLVGIPSKPFKESVIAMERSAKLDKERKLREEQVKVSLTLGGIFSNGV